MVLTRRTLINVSTGVSTDTHGAQSNSQGGADSMAEGALSVTSAMRNYSVAAKQSLLLAARQQRMD